jgi:hypothetical protein
MSQLTALKTEAATDLANAKTTITGYVRALEDSVAAHRTLAIVIAVVALFVGAAIGHFIK